LVRRSRFLTGKALCSCNTMYLYVEGARNWLEAASQYRER
jgi:hypothetical protein